MKRNNNGAIGEPSYVFSASQLERLINYREGPCVSIYFPAHRRKTDARSDSILYRNLCRAVEKVLERDATAAVAKRIVANLRALDEPAFWEKGSEGVAVFAAPQFFECYRLPVEFQTLEVVGVSFHTKPLIRYLQEGLSYHVLALSLHRVSLFDGWEEGLQLVPLRNVPRSLEDALGTETITGYRGAHPRGENRIHHSQGASREDNKQDVEKFFREVARGLSKNGLGESRKPLILAAQSHYQPMFRRVAQLPNLLDEGIVADAGKLTEDYIRSEARRILSPELEERVRVAKEEYAISTSRGQASERLGEIARAVAQGRVKRLFVETGRRIWGLLDAESGDVLPGETRKNAYDVDLLDELAELTLARRGEVLVLSRDQMPSGTGVAATYRY